MREADEMEESLRYTEEAVVSKAWRVQSEMRLEILPRGEVAAIGGDYGEWHPDTTRQ